MKRFKKSTSESDLSARSNYSNYDIAKVGIENRLKAAKTDIFSHKEMSQKIFDSLPIGMHLYHLEEDQLIFDRANPEADTILGVNNLLLYGKTIQEAFPFFIETEIPVRYQEVARNVSKWQSENISYHDGDQLRTLEVRAFGIGSGKMAAVFFNIDERRHNENALKKSESDFRSLFEATPMGAVMVVNRKFKRLSSKFLNILGYTEEELIDKPTRAVYPDDEMDQHVGAELYRTMKENGLGRCEAKVQRKDGQIIDILIYASPLDSNDFSKGITAILEDRTLQKKTEEEKKRLQEELIQSQKMESIGRLAGGIAHDFNNLLTAILGNAELAVMDTESEVMKSYLNVINQAATSASELTKQLLAFSRKQIIDPKVVNLNEMIEGMHKMLQRVIGENIILRSVSQPGLYSVKVDISQIQQIIVNLAANARDAMPDGGTLCVETGNVIIDEDYCKRHAYDNPGDHVMIAVSDNGMGMNKETQEHLFEPFYTTKSIGKGTGLGLATVYGAVKQNGGTIDVYSEPGNGTSIKVYFPRTCETLSTLGSDVTSDTLPTGTETILLVEDNPLVLDFSRNLLILLGYNVISAGNGEDAIEIARESAQKIDLIMTDVILPGINGKVMAEMIKGMHPSIKILYNSGYTKNAIVAHGVLREGLHFIGKPFSAFALARKIREILDNK